MSIIEKDKQYVAGTYNRFPVEIVSGKGSVVVDTAGKEYIDMGSGIGVTSFGIGDDTWKEAVIAHLTKLGHEVEDMGCHSLQSCDYPQYGRAVAHAVADGTCERGIVICTTGIGISIVANKVPGIRAGLCSDTTAAYLTRAHNDANVLCLGGRFLDAPLALAIVDTFLKTPMDTNPKYQKRMAIACQE